MTLFDSIIVLNFALAHCFLTFFLWPKRATPVSDAVRLFLRRVVIDQAFPLELKVPNAQTRAAMEESRTMMATRRARFANVEELFADLEKNSSK